jgi:hypothetical protein
LTFFNGLKYALISEISAGVLKILKKSNKIGEIELKKFF